MIMLFYETCSCSRLVIKNNYVFSYVLGTQPGLTIPNNYYVSLTLLVHFLPFSTSFGDQMLQTHDDVASEPLITSNLTYPLFGRSLDTIFVSINLQ